MESGVGGQVWQQHFYLAIGDDKGKGEGLKGSLEHWGIGPARLSPVDEEEASC